MRLGAVAVSGAAVGYGASKVGKLGETFEVVRRC